MKVQQKLELFFSFELCFLIFFCESYHYGQQKKEKLENRPDRNMHETVLFSFYLQLL